MDASEVEEICFPQQSTHFRSIRIFESKGSYTHFHAVQLLIDEFLQVLEHGKLITTYVTVPAILAQSNCKLGWSSGCGTFPRRCWEQSFTNQTSIIPQTDTADEIMLDAFRREDDPDHDVKHAT